MTKAQITINMPINCFHCPCRCIEYEECRLVEKDCEHGQFEEVGRPAWCPLVEVKKDPIKHHEDIKQLDLMILRQRRQCAGIYNPYMHGLLNGMLYVRSLLIEDSPTLVTKSELLAEDIQPHYNCVGVDYWGENRLIDEEEEE